MWRVAGFAIFAVVDKGVYRNAGDQLRETADVIVVIVGDEHVVDPGEAGSFSDGDDAIGVAAVVAGPTGVDEQGLPVRGDKQRSLPTFDVDEKDS